MSRVTPLVTCGTGELVEDKYTAHRNAIANLLKCVHDSMSHER